MIKKTTPSLSRSLTYVVFVFLIILFFWPFFLKGLLPIPSDTLVGLYHPWRDTYATEYSRGLPYKNFLITDPVRQQIPWRMLAVDSLKKGKIPLWNPYSFAGTPLLANHQSAVFYPLNLLFFILPFPFAWSLLVALQPLLAGLFTYWLLRHWKIGKLPALLGGLVFAFSGFSVAWLEWGTVGHSALWLPLVLLAVDKMCAAFSSDSKFPISNFKFLISPQLRWGLILICSLTFSLFAGHLQTTFYLVIFSVIYLFWRLSQQKIKGLKVLLLFFIFYLSFFILSSVQWLPTLKFILLSAREADLSWPSPGWFLPWRHLVQFLAPDFFGNPATLNYWGEWNYGEFVGYIGVVPLSLAVWGIWANQGDKGGMSDKGDRARRRLTFFLTASIIVFLSFALPTPWAKLPFLLKVPFLGTAQPTRLLFIVDFCLALLAALGLDRLSRRRKKAGETGLIRVIGVFGIIFAALWGFVLLAPRFWPGAEWLANLPVARRNLILPTLIWGAWGGVGVLGELLKKKPLITKCLPLTKNRNFDQKWGRLPVMLSAVFLLTVFDLFRFGWKFTPFTDQRWLYPSTRAIEFLQKDPEIFRIMATDRRLLPPNVSSVYGLQTLDGYDPLYLQRFAELLAASERHEPDIASPFGFNRIITPQNYLSPIIDLANVKYVLSLQDEVSPKLEKIYQEGETRIYQNSAFLPRAFIVYRFRVAKDSQKQAAVLFDPNFDPRREVVLEKDPGVVLKEGQGTVWVESYENERITLRAETDQRGILVLSDAYYPNWKADVDGRPVTVYPANYVFRAVVVEPGSHVIVWRCR